MKTPPAIAHWSSALLARSIAKITRRLCGRTGFRPTPAALPRHGLGCQGRAVTSDRSRPECLVLFPNLSFRITCDQHRLCPSLFRGPFQSSSPSLCIAKPRSPIGAPVSTSPPAFQAVTEMGNSAAATWARRLAARRTSICKVSDLIDARLSVRSHFSGHLLIFANGQLA